MDSPLYRAAALQAVVLLALAALLIGGAALRSRAPFDRDTLAIQVSLLRSNAAEADLLFETAAEDRLAPGFVHQHARQLLRDVGRIDRKLSSKPAIRSLATQHAQAQRMTRSLTVALARAAEQHLQPEPATPFAPLAAQLDALHSRLEPTDD
jgi:hypothetical protein